MKRYLIIILVFVGIVNLCALKNWDIFTNTSHTYDAVQVEERIFVATWGGLTIYDTETYELFDKLTVADGLLSNHITALAYNELSETLIIGTNQEGVQVLKNNLPYATITTENGLVSNQINTIAIKDSIMFIGTTNGVSSYKLEDNFPIPLSLNTYTTENIGLTSNNIVKICLYGDQIIFLTDSCIALTNENDLDVDDSWTIYPVNERPTDAIVFQDMFLYSDGSSVYRLDESIDDPVINIADLIDSEEELNITCLGNYFGKLYVGIGVWDKSFAYLEQQTEIDHLCFKFIENEFIIDSSNELDDVMKTKSIYSNLSHSIFSTWGNGIKIQKINGDWINKIENELSTNVISDIAIDNQNNVWVSGGHFGGSPRGFTANGVSQYTQENAWINYNINNANLHNDNINGISSIQDKVIFGSWWTTSDLGSNTVSYFDLNENEFFEPNWHDDLTSPTVSDIETDVYGNIWIINYNDGVNFIDNDFEYSTSIIGPSNIEDKTYVKVGFHYDNENTIFIGSNNSGLFQFNFDYNFPQNHSPVVEFNGFSQPDITTGRIYDIKTWTSGTIGDYDFECKTFVAHSTGLYMYDGEYWYRFPINRKYEKYINGNWDDEDSYYFEDEQHIYDNNISIPTALLVDAFDRLWIGTENQGISIMHIPTFTFDNYKKDDFQLLKYPINELAYDGMSGRVYIGTEFGLGSVIAGSTIKTSEKVKNIYAYPNPFYADNNSVITIEAKKGTLPEGQNKCSIFDIAGDLIVELKEQKTNDFIWNGKNEAGKECASGLYYYLVIDGNGDAHKGKIVLLRKS